MVLLSIEVDEAGAVQAVQVVQRPPGAHADAFALSARQAALGFVFEPATRDGQAVPARIGYRYVFEPEAPEPAAPSTSAPPPDTAQEEGAEAQGEAPPLEFGAVATARAASRSASEQQVRADTVKQFAGTRGDALRAVELMPGVGRAQDGAGEVLVRGASPADTQIMLEGSPVLLLYHVGGFTSFFNSQLLQRLDFVPGNFSARYGRAIGGVVDVRVRDPRRDTLHGTVDVNLIDAFVVAEGPVSDRGAVAVAARRSYVDFFFDEVADADSFNVVAAPVYWDYQAVATLEVGGNDQLRLLGYGSRDSLHLLVDEPQDGEPRLRGDMDAVTEFHRVELRWKHRYNRHTRHEITAGAGWLGMNLQLGELVSQEIRGPRIYARGEWQTSPAPWVTLYAGVDHYTLSAEVKYAGSHWVQDSAVQQGQRILVDEWVTIHRPAAYVEAAVRPTDRTTLLPGVRVDYSSDAGTVTVDPRLTVRHGLGTRTTLKAAAGWFHQPPELGSHIERLGNPDIDSAHALHTSAGVEHEVDGLSLGIEGYHKQLWDLPVDTPNNEAPHLVNEGRGRIYGVETTARYRDARYFGYLSYTLSRSERRVRQGQYRLSDFDQPHILTFAASAKLGVGWELSTTFRLVSGTPRTPVQAGLYNAATGQYLAVVGEENSERRPLYHRLDLRLLKRWAVGRGAISAYVDVQNVYNARNADSVDYSFDYRQSERVGGLPIIPSVGLRGEL